LEDGRTTELNVRTFRSEGENEKRRSFDL